MTYEPINTLTLRNMQFGVVLCQINNKIQLNQLNQRWATNGFETTTNQIQHNQ